MSKRDEMIQAIMEGFHTIRRSFNSNHLGIRNKGEITPSQWPVIASLGARQTISLKELTKMLHVSSSAVTQLVDALVAKGFVTRKESPDDRRIILIELTKKARDSLAQMKTKATEHLTTVFSSLTDSDLVEYQRIIGKVSENIDRLKL